MSSKTHRLVVVGGGVAGLQTARALFRAGFTRVTVLEESDDVGSGTSFKGINHEGKIFPRHAALGMDVLACKFPVTQCRRPGVRAQWPPWPTTLPWSAAQMPEFPVSRCSVRPTGPFPTTREMQEYARAYAHAFNLYSCIKLNCKLVNLAPDAQNRWVVSYTNTKPLAPDPTRSLSAFWQVQYPLLDSTKLSCFLINGTLCQNAYGCKGGNTDSLSQDVVSALHLAKERGHHQTTASFVVTTAQGNEDFRGKIVHSKDLKDLPDLEGKRVDVTDVPNLEGRRVMRPCSFLKDLKGGPDLEGKQVVGPFSFLKDVSVLEGKQAVPHVLLPSMCLVSSKGLDAPKMHARKHT
eukprot:1138736-Pelagomonas_calceolata.AAC.7